MSILNKITPGPWKIHLAKWHKDGPAEGFTITSSIEQSDGQSRQIASLNTHTNTRVFHGGDNLRPAREYYLTPEEFDANVKAIAAVPDMLSIIERLSNTAHAEPEYIYALISESQKLLNELNK